jgi:hypothetical protein
MASTCGLTWPITVAYTPQQHFTVLANTRFKKGLLLPVLADKPPKLAKNEISLWRGEQAGSMGMWLW